MGLRAGVTTFVYAVTTFFYEIVVVLLQSYLRRRGVLNGAVEDKIKSSVLNSNQRIMSPTEFSIDFHKISQFGQNHLPRTSSCLECAGRQCACHAAVHPCESQT